MARNDLRTWGGLGGGGEAPPPTSNLYKQEWDRSLLNSWSEIKLTTNITSCFNRSNIIPLHDANHLDLFIWHTIQG